MRRPALLCILAVLCAAPSGCSHTPSAADALPPDSRPRPADGHADGPADAGAATVQVVLNEAYPPALFALVDGAQSTLDIVHFMINKDSAGDDFVRRLGAAAARGVTVRVVMENSVDGNRARVTELKADGVDARLDGASIYTHAKLAVADERRALFGSSNGSWSSMYQNNEANVLVQDAAIAPFFAAYARAIHLDPSARPGKAAPSSTLGKALDDGDYVAEARQLIQNAKRRAWLVVYGLNLDDRYPQSDVFQLVDLLAAAQKRGADVRVILEQSDYGASVDSLNREAAAKLLSRGIPARLDPPARITHAKVLVCDDEAIVGSNNWGYGGFSLYHEVGLRTAEPAAVSALVRYHEGIWAQSTKPASDAGPAPAEASPQ